METLLILTFDAVFLGVMGLTGIYGLIAANINDENRIRKEQTMETVAFILIVAGAVWYLYRHMASALKDGSQSCACGGCSVGYSPDDDRRIDAMTVRKDINAECPSACADADSRKKKDIW